MSFLRRILDMEKAKEDFVRRNPMVTGIGLTPICGILWVVGFWHFGTSNTFRYFGTS